MAKRPRYEEFFATEHLNQGLRARSVSGAADTLVAQAIKFFLHVGTTMVLARLLVPGDFGLIAAVVAVTGLILLFKELGLASATVQKKDLSHEQVSTLFWVNIGFAAGSALLTLAVAPAIAAFYGEPRLTAIASWLALGMLLGGLSVQHQALLRRRMSFRTLAIVDLFSQLVAAAAALLIAWRGGGYRALIAQQLVAPAMFAIAVWVVCRWRPGLPVRGSGVRAMLRFGGDLTVFNLVNYAARNLDNVIIGRLFGRPVLGQYSKAYALLMLPLSQLTGPLSGIAIPALSRLQDAPDRFRSFYLAALRVMALVSMPMIAVMGVLSVPLMRTVLGAQWQQAGELFGILAWGALWQPILASTGWVFISLGRTRRMAIFGTAASAFRCIAMVIGLRWGVEGVAWAVSLSNWAMAAPTFWAAYRGSPIDARGFFDAMTRPVVLTAVVAAASALAARLVSGSVTGASDFLILMVGSLAAGLTLGISFALHRGLREDLRYLWNLRRDLSGTAGSKE